MNLVRNCILLFMIDQKCLHQKELNTISFLFNNSFIPKCQFFLNILTYLHLPYCQWQIVNAT